MSGSQKPVKNEWKKEWNGDCVMFRVCVDASCKKGRVLKETY